ncbi:MAG: EamA family transporter [Gammaproteobacteria bacterium]|nr:MAG: EamA family transporter [Gammaproteobacteria bacterium]
MQVAILYAIVVLIWGSTWLAITYQIGVVAEEVSVAYRFALGSVSLFIYAALSRRKVRIPWNSYGYVVLMGALMFSVSYLFVYHGAAYIPSGLVAVIFSLIVVTNALFERVFFKTRFESRLLLASLLGVIGVGLIFWPEISNFSLQDQAMMGVLLVTMSVLVASLGNMTAIINTNRGLPVVAVNAHAMAWGALFSAAVAVLFGRPFNFLFEFEYIASLAYLSVFGSAIAFGCYLALLRTIGSTRASYSSVLFPIVALLISTFVEDYQWSTMAVSGIVFIIAGNWLALSKRKGM